MFMNLVGVHPAFFGSRDQKRIEKAKPAKKVDAARAVWPAFRPKIADAVQLVMISTIRTMIRMRRRSGVSMVSR